MWVAGRMGVLFFFSSRRRHTRFKCDWSSDVCSSDLASNAPCRAISWACSRTDTAGMGHDSRPGRNPANTKEKTPPALSPNAAPSRNRACLHFDAYPGTQEAIMALEISAEERVFTLLN